MRMVSFNREKQQEAMGSGSDCLWTSSGRSGIQTRNEKAFAAATTPSFFAISDLWQLHLQSGSYPKMGEISRKTCLFACYHLKQAMGWGKEKTLRSKITVDCSQKKLGSFSSNVLLIGDCQTTHAFTCKLNQRSKCKTQHSGTSFGFLMLPREPRALKAMNGLQ